MADTFETSTNHRNPPADVPVFENSHSSEFLKCGVRATRFARLGRVFVVASFTLISSFPLQILVLGLVVKSGKCRAENGEGAIFGAFNEREGRMRMTRKLVVGHDG